MCIRDRVGVAHAGDFRVDHHHGFVGEVHRQERALLNAGGRIANDEVKAVGGQLLQYFLNAVFAQRVFIAGLAGGQHIEIFEPLVLDQGLFE